MGQLAQNISDFWNRVQLSLFDFLEDVLDPLTEKQKQLIAILDLIQIERYIPNYSGYVGRPQKTRKAIARAFVAKTIYNMDTTVSLIERLLSDINFRRICGWEGGNIPSESTFSRAFAEFAKTGLPERVHQELIKQTLGDEVIQHNSRDSTAIEAREKVKVKRPRKISKNKKEAKKRGRPQKNEHRPVCEPTRIEKQKTMTLAEMLEDPPKDCDKGAKKDTKGNIMYWNGYKLHLDIVDAGIPVTAITTSASLHDSQVAIPLGILTSQEVTTLYDLMDSAYDVEAIKEHSKMLGHVPLIDENPRRNKERREELKAEAKARKVLNFVTPEEERYKQRTTAERANARLKDEFGAAKGS